MANFPKRCHAYRITDSFKLPVLNLTTMEKNICAHVLKKSNQDTCMSDTVNFHQSIFNLSLKLIQVNRITLR